MPTVTSTPRSVVAALAAAACLATATPAAQAQSIDSLGRPTPAVLNQIRDFANQSFVGPTTRSALLKAADFFEGTGKPGVELPVADAPIFTQFGWPTVAGNCIGGTQRATGTAIAVPGPALLPLPGVAAGETAFVFTALGTGKLAAEQPAPMNVNWININTRESGVTKLGDGGINPTGPATVTGTAHTGSGTVLAWLSGAVTVETGEVNEAGQPITAQCNFLPTGAVVHVP